MIEISSIGFVDVLTFNSSKGNLLTNEDMQYFTQHLHLVENNPNIKGIILTGKGTSFSTGLDISSVTSSFSKDKATAFFRAFDILLLRLFTFQKPIVAAINGHSIGAGFLIQCCSDIAIIADDSKIKLGLPELKLGLTIDELMICLLNYYVSPNCIGELLNCAEYFSPKRSLEFGFVEKVVPLADLLDICISAINNLIAFDTNSFSNTKQLLRAKNKANMQSAINNECYNVFTKLLTEKYLRK
jgi:Delta3-Delta2-enoyl-CoA isomerase